MCCRQKQDIEIQRPSLLPAQQFSGLRICIVGNAGVGKTCLLHRFCGSNYPGDGAIRSTIGTDVFMTRLACTEQEQLLWPRLVSNGAIPVMLQDTAGQERFNDIPRQMLRSASVVIMVYSLEDSDSLQQLEQRWYPMVQQNCRQRCSILVVGNKSDLLGNSEALYQEEMLPTLCQLLERNDEQFAIVETSAKSDPGARLIFEALIRRVATRLTQSDG